MSFTISPPRSSSPPPVEEFNYEVPSPIIDDHAFYSFTPHRVRPDGTIDAFDTLYSSHKDLFAMRASYKSYEKDHCPDCPQPKPFRNFLIMATLPSYDPALMEQHRQIMREEMN